MNASTRSRVRRPAILWIAGALALAFATSAPAQDYGSLSGNPLTLAGDARLVVAEGEASWIDGGFGKARFGGDEDGDLRVRPEAVEADLVWQPELSWSLGATLALTAQHGQEHAIDLSEAFLFYRHDPIGAIRLSTRAGLFWPPVSLEHSGPEWAVTETITPSAINSWIGEEVKLVGWEASGSLPLWGGRLRATGALFGWNDTSGTLLAFRGWALHDQKATAFGRQRLPPLDGFMTSAQAARTRPVIEIDDRVGFYGGIGWSASGVRVEALHYDNRGDPEAVTATMQWGWRTRFDSLGARVDVTPELQLTGQAMTGTTEMGFPRGGRIWVDTRFRSAFAMATQQIGSASLSGRVEAFDTRGRGSVTAGEDDEEGWAFTLAARRPFGEHVTLLAEVLRVESERDARLRDALDPHQAHTVAQIAIRVRN